MSSHVTAGMPLRPSLDSATMRAARSRDGTRLPVYQWLTQPMVTPSRSATWACPVRSIQRLSFIRAVYWTQEVISNSLYITINSYTQSIFVLQWKHQQVLATDRENEDMSTSENLKLGYAIRAKAQRARYMEGKLTHSEYYEWLGNFIGATSAMLPVCDDTIGRTTIMKKPLEYCYSCGYHKGYHAPTCINHPNHSHEVSFLNVDAEYEEEARLDARDRAIACNQER